MAILSDAYVHHSLPYTSRICERRSVTAYFTGIAHIGVLDVAAARIAAFSRWYHGRLSRQTMTEPSPKLAR